MKTIGKVISILLSVSAGSPAFAAPSTPKALTAETANVDPSSIASTKRLTTERPFSKRSVTVRATFAYQSMRCSMTGSGVLLAPNVVISSAHIVFADSSKLAAICPRFYKALPSNSPNLYSAHKLDVWIDGKRYKAIRAAVPRGYLGIRHRELEHAFRVNPFVYGSRLNDIARIELVRPTSVPPQQYAPIEQATPGVMTVLPRSGHPILQIRRSIALTPHSPCAGTARLTEHVVADCVERVPMTMRGAVLALDEEGMPEKAQALNGVSGAPLFDAAGRVIGVFSGCRWDSDGDVQGAYITLFGRGAMDLIAGRLQRAILLPLH